MVIKSVATMRVTKLSGLRYRATASSYEKKKERPGLGLSLAKLGRWQRPVGHGYSVHIDVAAVVIDIGAGDGTVSSDDGCKKRQ